MPDLKEQLSRLNAVSNQTVALYHKAALAVGVSDSALGVLYALLQAAEPCSQYDLCNDLSLPKQTINTTVALLQKKGFVSLSHIPGTRNKKSVALTDTGREFAKKTVGVLRAAELDALSKLTAQERETYILLNEKYNRHLTEHLNSLLAEMGED